MKSLVVKDNVFYFVNIGEFLGLHYTNKLRDVKSSYLLGKNNNSQSILVTEVTKINDSWIPYTGKERLAFDAWYAMKVFKVKAKIAAVAAAFDDAHAAEKKFTLQLIGLLEPIFQEEE